MSPRDSLPDDQAAFYSVHHLSIEGTKIGVICLNSAWLSGRNRNAAGKIIDYGQLCVGRTQITAAFRELQSNDLVICVLHHPLSWLAEFDRNTTQELLFSKCHFILHGHEHLPQVHVTESTLGDVIVIPSGATYADDAGEDERYINAYNFVSIDTDSGVGHIFFRRWHGAGHGWKTDTFLAPDGQFEFNLPKWQGALDATRKQALNLLVSRNKKALRKRFIDNLHIEIRMKVQEFDGMHLVEFKIRHIADIAEGDEELFVVDYQKGRHVESIIQKYGVAVRQLQEAECKLDGEPCGEPIESEERRTFEIKLHSQKCRVQYGYAVRMLPNDEYHFTFGRVVRRVRLHIYQDEGLSYEYLPLGGALLKEPRYDPFSDAWETASEDMSFPEQGYLIVWRHRV